MGSSAGPIIGLQGAGSLLGAYGQYQASHANAAILRMNAEYARTQAAQAMQAGEFKAGQLDIRGEVLAGKQATAFASQGVVAGAGSAGTVVAGTEAMTEQEKSIARLNARRQAYGFEVAAANDEFQADTAIRTGNMQAAATLLSGAGSAATTAAMFNGGGGGAASGGGGSNGYV